MNQSHKLNTVSLSLLLTIVVCGNVLSQELSTNRYFRSGPGFVLLQNGEVLSGDVQAFELELEVKLDQTGSVRFPNNKVAHVGATLDELYMYQANRIQQWALGDHLRLGRWCTQQGMFARAMPHYEYLKQQIPDRSEFKQFQAELRDAMLKNTEVQNALKTAGYDVSRNATSPVSTASSVNSSSSTTSLQKAQHVARVEPQDQDVFRTDIHPVLISSCARAACHGAFSSNGFVLADASRMSSRDATGRNLAAFTNYLNSRKGTAESLPEEHPLYKKAVNQHGQLFESPLNINDPKHQRFMEQLRLWIARANSHQQQSSSDIVSASSNATTTSTTTTANSTSNLIPSVALPPSLGPQAAEYFKKKEAEATARQNAATLLQGKEMSSITAAIAKLEEIERQRLGDKDPFDPNEFNKLYGPQASQESAADTQTAAAPSVSSTK